MLVGYPSARCNPTHITPNIILHDQKNILSRLGNPGSGNVLEALCTAAEPGTVQDVVDVPAPFAVDIETTADQGEGVVDAAIAGSFRVANGLLVPLAGLNLLHCLDVQTVIEG